MVMCCRQNHLPFVTVYIKPERHFTDRKLETARCPICGALIAELRQFNINKNCYEIVRPKRGHAAAFIRKMSQKEWRPLEIKTFSKGNAGYVYGENREYKSGRICQYAVDFNGEKRLVKIID